MTENATLSVTQGTRFLVRWLQILETTARPHFKTVITFGDNHPRTRVYFQHCSDPGYSMGRLTVHAQPVYSPDPSRNRFDSLESYTHTHGRVGRLAGAQSHIMIMKGRWSGVVVSARYG